jgi:hypothetical protein
MKKLTKAEFEALSENQQLEKLQEIVDMTGAEIDLEGDTALWDLYSKHFPKAGDTTKAIIYPLETLRCKDDDGKRRLLLRGEKAVVGTALAEQLLTEALAANKPQARAGQ